MAVTYAWKIDSQLYAYIVNPNCFVLGGNGIRQPQLDPQYTNQADDYMGYVSSVPLNDRDSYCVKEFARSKFASGGDVEFTNYATYFDYMLQKIHNFSPDNGVSYPYRYVDLLSPEKYFNVDADCGDLTGADGQPALIDDVTSSIRFLSTSDEKLASFSVTASLVDRTFEEFTGLIDLLAAFGIESIESVNDYYFTSASTYYQLEGDLNNPGSVEIVSDNTGWAYSEEWFNNGVLTINATDVPSPDFIYNPSTDKFYLKKDTNEKDNRYHLNFDLVLPSPNLRYEPNSVYISDENRIADGNVRMPANVGGLAAGTVLSSVSGMNYSELFNEILFPEKYPSLSTKPSASISINKNGLSTFYYPTDNIADVNNDILNVLVTVNHIAGHFNAEYDMKELYGVEANYSATTGKTIPSISTTAKTVTLTWTGSCQYTAPTNKPVTARNKPYDGEEATWTDGTATTTTSTKIYFVNPIKTNIQGEWASNGEWQISGTPKATTDIRILPRVTGQKEFVFDCSKITGHVTFKFDKASLGDKFQAIQGWTSKDWLDIANGVEQNGIWMSNDTSDVKRFKIILKSALEA